MKPSPSNPGESGDDLQEIITIELITGDRAEALKQFCAQVLKTGGDVSLSKLENLPPLPAPPQVQKQYLEGIFTIVESIVQYGKVEMPRELYDMFSECAKIQGTTLERIVATIIFQREQGEPVELTRFL